VGEWSTELLRQPASVVAVLRVLLSPPLSFSLLPSFLPSLESIWYITGLHFAAAAVRAKQATAENERARSTAATCRGPCGIVEREREREREREMEGGAFDSYVVCAERSSVALLSLSFSLPFLPAGRKEEGTLDHS
jgi:hypothetical protein